MTSESVTTVAGCPLLKKESPLPSECYALQIDCYSKKWSFVISPRAGQKFITSYFWELMHVYLQGKITTEQRAFSGFAFCGNNTSVVFHNFFADGQTHSGTVMRYIF
jgi:hypothetical protein